MQECYLLSEKRMATHKCVQETNIALIQQQMKYIVDKLDKLTHAVENFINESKKDFATKDEVREHSKQIKALQDQDIKINLLIAKVSWAAIAISALISFILNKLF